MQAAVKKVTDDTQKSAANLYVKFIQKAQEKVLLLRSACSAGLLVCLVGKEPMQVGICLAIRHKSA